MFTINRDERFDTIRDLHQLKNLWVGELGMSLYGFKQAVEKILKFNVRWNGEAAFSWSTYVKVLRTITLCSYEYDGEVSAHVFMGGTGRSGKVPFAYKDRPFLAIYETKFTVIVESLYLNIAELIFWIDTDKCDIDDLGTDVFVGDFM